MKQFKNFVLTEKSRLLGKDVFGELRKTGQPDTEFQKQLLRRLNGYIYDPKLNRVGLIELLDHVKKIRSKHKQLQPKYDLVYRGFAYTSVNGFSPITVSNMLYTKIIVQKQAQKKKIGTRNYYILKNSIIYSPRFSLQSWSSDEKTAAWFSTGTRDIPLKYLVDNYYRPMAKQAKKIAKLETREVALQRIFNPYVSHIDQFPIIIRKKPNKDFLFTSQIMNKVSDMSFGLKQNQVLYYNKSKKPFVCDICVPATIFEWAE